MSDWKQGFRKHMIDTLIAQGSPIAARTDIFGWQDFEARNELRTQIGLKGIDYDQTTWTESDWYMFTDTFNDPDHKYGVDLTIVLLDGTAIKWRYDGTISELMQGILKD